MSNFNLCGELKIKKNNWGGWSHTLKSKNLQTGQNEFMSVSVGFKKDHQPAEGTTQINVQEAFLTFYNGKSGKVVKILWQTFLILRLLKL